MFKILLLYLCTSFKVYFMQAIAIQANSIAKRKSKMDNALLEYFNEITENGKPH